MKPKHKNILKAVIFSFCAFILFSVYGSYYYQLSPDEFLTQGIKILTVPIVAKWYAEDADTAREIRRNYWIGDEKLVKKSPIDSWQQMEKKIPGFKIISWCPKNQIIHDIPFIYEKINALQLVELRNQYDFKEILGDAANEYEKMLRLGAWLGTRWDHGVDEVPGGTNLFHVAEVIKAGENGSEFWCEIAAKVTVQTATALGIPARLVTGSKNGYSYDHGIAELWSNQFNKWFLLDTDFNLVFESDGIPLSAFELCHKGPRLQQSGDLHIRRFAAPKPSINHIDLIPFFRYVHIDMRNDWYSRRLPRGSPAGGELSTWWTARADLEHLLTSKIRVDNQAEFDWQVNRTSIHLLDIKAVPEGYRLDISLTGYSPYFKDFFIALDNFSWKKMESFHRSVFIPKGIHTLRARMITETGDKGPISELTFSLVSRSELGNER